MNNLLLKFRSKTTEFGVTRETLKKVAKALDVTETTAVHMAVAKFAKEVLPSYEADDGPLTTQDIKRIKAAAKPHMPRGKSISKRSLL